MPSLPARAAEWRFFRRSAATARPWLRRFDLGLPCWPLVLGLAWSILRHQVNFPFLDDWMFTPMYERRISGAVRVA